jgi:hypothetical protein
MSMEQAMSITWERWDAMCASLDYSWQRMVELSEPRTPDGEAEYQVLVEHAMETANRLVGLSLADTPPLSSAKLRERWEEGRRSAMQMRERIVVESAAAAERTSLAEAESDTASS